MIEEGLLRGVSSGERKLLEAVPDQSWADINTTHGLINIFGKNSYFWDAFLELVWNLEAQRKYGLPLRSANVPTQEIFHSPKIRVWFEKAAAEWGRAQSNGHDDRPEDKPLIYLHPGFRPPVIGYQSHGFSIAYSLQDNGKFFVTNRLPQPPIGPLDNRRFASPGPPSLTPEGRGAVILRAAFAQMQLHNSFAIPERNTAPSLPLGSNQRVLLTA